MLAWRHAGLSAHNEVRVRVIVLIEDSKVIRRILEHLRLWAPCRLMQMVSVFRFPY
ncbi:MAG: hypothetical protein HYS65_09735 [Betaproteobacteria bacterium]|nr:hypothetical protein [Betaproteobacteria bacterium]MBI2227113.1 hypothetical protein [Betaproteobacteria bacterium]MBI2293163.1 hypothetical protein [Betaproteobacteria bacterium]MBI3056934.1 hypothetical protein [Betaproteobacteria bacterium]